MRKKMSVKAVMMVILSLMVIGIQSQCFAGTIDDMKPMTIKLTSITPVGHPIYSGLEMFKSIVESNTNGKVTVNLYPESQLGSQQDQFEMVKSGAVHLGHIGGPTAGSLVKQYNIGGTLYLFRDYNHFLKVWGGQIGKELAAKLKPHGIHVLSSYGMVGTRHILSKKPVKSLADLDGLKIRTPPAGWATEGFKALGANPTTIAFSEVYTALQLGTVDAMECPLDWIYKMRFYEVAKNLTLTGHNRGDTYQYLANDKWWNSLPEELKVVLTEASHVASMHANTNILIQESVYRKKMEQEGVTFFEVDNEPFQKKASSKLADISKVWGGDMELYKSIIETE